MSDKNERIKTLSEQYAEYTDEQQNAVVDELFTHLYSLTLAMNVSTLQMWPMSESQTPDLKLTFNVESIPTIHKVH